MLRLAACTLVLLIAIAAQAADKDEEKTAKKADKNKIEDITFDDIKLDLAKDEDFDEQKVTERVKELEDQKIRIRGWILPTSVFQTKGIKEFVLVRDDKECCFGPGAALYDCIIVEMEAGQTAEFTVKPVEVEGTFQLRPLKDELDGKHYAIYFMRARRVK